MDRSKPYPGFWHAVLLCVVFVGAQMAIGIVLAILDAILNLKLARHPGAVGLINLCAFAAVLSLVWLIDRPNPREVIALRRVSALAIMAVFVFTGGAIILLSEVDNLFRAVLPVPRFIQELFLELGDASKHLWSSLFLLAMVAPVTEEIMLRGVILRGFLKRFGFVRAMLLSSVLFGAMHLNPWQFISATLLGMLFAWWYARTQSLVPCLIGHALANGTMVLHRSLPFEIRGFNAGDPFASTAPQPLWFDALGFVLLAAGLWMFQRATPPIPPPAESPPAPPII